MNRDIDKNILNNSKYIIQYFTRKKKEVSNLKLQKLLYFLEAIYLLLFPSEEKLFEEEFMAWDFGPVNEKIYRHYKEHGGMPIVLKENEKIEINPINETLIEKLYDLLGDFSAFDLVSISHMEGSPWFSINEEYSGNIPHDVVINKNDTREWIKTFVKEQ